MRVLNDILNGQLIGTWEEEEYIFPLFNVDAGYISWLSHFQCLSCRIKCSLELLLWKKAQLMTTSIWSLSAQTHMLQSKSNYRFFSISSAPDGIDWGAESICQGRQSRGNSMCNPRCTGASIVRHVVFWCRSDIPRQQIRLGDADGRGR